LLQIKVLPTAAALDKINIGQVLDALARLASEINQTYVCL
jgi:hypothetical protein